MPVKELALEIEIEVKNPTALRKGRPRADRQPSEPEPPRISRLARLIALAIKFEDMVERGEVQDFADLARLGYVTRARITQIMNLLNLAPDLQQALLEDAELALSERDLRPITTVVSWKEQRRLFGIVSNRRDFAQLRL